MLAAMVELRRGYPRHLFQIVNFGEPRFFTSYDQSVIDEINGLLDGLQTRYVNVENGKIDLIPAVPPISPNARWHHAVSGYGLYENGDILFGGHNGGGRSDWPDKFNGENHKFEITAHSILKYKANLGRAIGISRMTVFTGLPGLGLTVFVVGVALLVGSIVFALAVKPAHSVIGWKAGGYANTPLLDDAVHEAVSPARV